jgi:hypothetical protein
MMEGELSGILDYVAKGVANPDPYPYQLISN